MYQNKTTMKKLSKLIIGLLLVSSVSAFATEDKKESVETATAAEAATFSMNTITGRVIDNTSGEALAGVTVTIEGTDMVAFTDFDGNFKFTDVNLRSAKISASFISYEKSQLSIFPNTNEVVLTMKSVY